MRRDEHARIGPQLWPGRPLELTDIDVEGRAPEPIARERIDERVFVDNLPARHVDEHGPRLHGGEALGVESTGGLCRPLTSDRHEIARGQEAVKIARTTEFAKPGW